jgi:hypothetical protein
MTKRKFVNNTSVEYFSDPSICATYRQRMLKLFDLSDVETRKQSGKEGGRLRVLILQRSSGSVCVLLY